MGTFKGLDPGKELRPETVLAIEVFKLLTRTAEGRRRFILAKDNRGRQALFAAMIRDMINLPDDDARLPPELRDPKVRAKVRRKFGEEFPGVGYATIPAGIRVVLEKLSDSELALLSDLDAAYVEAGLCLTANPVPTAVH
jgi:hypothetical protein